MVLMHVETVVPFMKTPLPQKSHTRRLRLKAASSVVPVQAYDTPVVDLLKPMTFSQDVKLLRGQCITVYCTKL